MKITDFNIKIDLENVLHLIECYPDSPVYESVVDELEEILEEAYQKIRPAALFEFGSVEEYDLTEYGENITEALFNINSIGGALSEWSTASFAEGKYLRGILIDAIADDSLFQIDREIQLAKSAVRAGLETLILRYGVTYEEIDKYILPVDSDIRSILRRQSASGCFLRNVGRRFCRVHRRSVWLRM